MDLGVAEEVAQREVVVACPNARIDIDGGLERTDGKRGAVGPKACGGVREPGLEAAGRKAKRGVAHDREGYLAGRRPRRMFGMSNTPQRPGTTGTSGVTGGERRRLDRAPGERYADRASGSGPAQAPVPARWGVVPIGIAVLVADLGAVLFFALGLLDLGIGLVVVAAFAGWVTALALVWRGRSSAVPQPGSRMAVAAFLGGWVVVAGMLIDWIYALLIGGVLGPLDYWAQRYGIVALIALVVGAVVAAARAR